MISEENANGVSTVCYTHRTATITKPPVELSCTKYPKRRTIVSAPSSYGGGLNGGKGTPMGRGTVFVAFIAFLVTGCTLWPERFPPYTLTDQQLSQLRAEVQAIGDKCRNLRVSGRHPGFVASVQCSNPGILAAYYEVNFPYMPLLDLALAKRLQLAERVDAKKISEGDMLVELFSDVRGLPAMPAP